MAQVVEHVGWGRRIMDSIKGIVVGLILFLASFALLGWNELNAVRNYRTVAEGRKIVVNADAAAVDPAKEGKLIHLSGAARTDEILKDAVFDVQANAMRLFRAVEMFQWQEKVDTRTEKKLGGGEDRIKTYSYNKVWSGHWIDSSTFEGPDRSAYVNPPSMPVTSGEETAQRAVLGAYKLHPTLVSQMAKQTAVDVRAGMAPESFRPRTREVPGGLYIGTDPAQPKIGDLKVTFAQTPPGDVSVLARQAAGGLEAYRSEKTGKSIHRLMDGTHPAPEMFDVLKQEAAMLAWILRAVGFLVMYAGLSMLFRPLSVLADVVPLFGTIVGFGTGLVAGILAGSLTLLTIAVCWFVVRPLVSVPLIIVAGVLLFKLRGKKSATVAPPAAV
ncbi:MAG: TMEM43 family protein [Kiritimatiellia bacterium]